MNLRKHKLIPIHPIELVLVRRAPICIYDFMEALILTPQYRVSGLKVVGFDNNHFSSIDYIATNVSSSCMH